MTDADLDFGGCAIATLGLMLNPDVIQKCFGGIANMPTSTSQGNSSTADAADLSKAMERFITLCSNEECHDAVETPLSDIKGNCTTDEEKKVAAGLELTFDSHDSPFCTVKDGDKLCVQSLVDDYTALECIKANTPDCTETDLQALQCKECSMSDEKTLTPASLITNMTQ